MKNTESGSKLLALGLAVGLLAGCATADRGQLADLLTTSVAFERGFVEGNPIFSGMRIGEIAAIKIGLTQVLKFTPEPVCTSGLWGMTTVGYGAALWNIGVMLGSGPAAIPLILGLVWWQHDKWMLSSRATCKDPWGFQPVTFFQSLGYEDRGIDWTSQ